MPSRVLVADIEVVPTTRSFIPPLPLLAAFELIKCIVDCCPLLLFDVLSFRLDESGRETAEASEAAARIVEREEGKVVIIRPCRTKSL